MRERLCQPRLMSVFLAAYNRGKSRDIIIAHVRITGTPTCGVRVRRQGGLVQVKIKIDYVRLTLLLLWSAAFRWLRHVASYLPCSMNLQQTGPAHTGFHVSGALVAPYIRRYGTNEDCSELEVLCGWLNNVLSVCNKGLLQFTL
jgi:hypothetical protein